MPILSKPVLFRIWRHHVGRTVQTIQRRWVIVLLTRILRRAYTVIRDFRWDQLRNRKMNKSNWNKIKYRPSSRSVVYFMYRLLFWFFLGKREREVRTYDVHCPHTANYKYFWSSKYYVSIIFLRSKVYHFSHTVLCHIKLAIHIIIIFYDSC